jgi:hypothetical protein
VIAGRLRTLLVALAAVSALVALPACGRVENPRTHAGTEGPYLDVGKLQYQVQISRLLNPADQEDRAYFVGVEDPEGLKGDEAWFSVWVRVWNRTEGTHPAARRFEIEDTTGKRYEPVEIGPGNVFAYRPAFIPSGASLPAVDSVAEQGAVGGSLLLFRVTDESLANRPLVLHIESPGAAPHEAEVDLDV